MSAVSKCTTEFHRTSGQKAGRSVDRFVLLDAQDWMSDDQLNALWTEINRTAAPGARVIFRTAAEDSLFQTELRALLDQWDYLASLASPSAQDRSAIYGGFHLYLKNTDEHAPNSRPRRTDGPHVSPSAPHLRPDPQILPAGPRPEIDGLDVPAGGSILELGCGTGRNMFAPPAPIPTPGFFGLDISAGMLETASAAIRREGLSGRITLARATPRTSTPTTVRPHHLRPHLHFLFPVDDPRWRRTIVAALAALDPAGSLHIVDFGDQDRLPGWFRAALRAWLARFHVKPRDSLREVLESECQRVGATLWFETLYRGYAVRAVVTRR